MESCQRGGKVLLCALKPIQTIQENLDSYLMHMAVHQHFLSLRVASNDCCCCVQSIQTFCFREKTNDQ